MNASNITSGTLNGNNVSVTNINASNINSGDLNCDRLNGGTISGQTINGGSISGTSISGSTLTSDKGDGTKTEINGGRLQIWSNGNGEKYLTLYETVDGTDYTLKIGGGKISIEGGAYHSLKWQKILDYLDGRV